MRKVRRTLAAARAKPASLTFADPCRYQVRQVIELIDRYEIEIE